MRFIIVMLLCVFMILSGVISVPFDATAEECPIEVTEMVPDGFAESTRPVLSATLTSKCGNDIDVASVELILNDEVYPAEVTGSGSKITVKFLPDWNLAQESDHFVMVRAKDKKGTTVEKEWSFWLGLIY